jgi:hypothetical protein
MFVGEAHRSLPQCGTPERLELDLAQFMHMFFIATEITTKSFK